METSKLDGQKLPAIVFLFTINGRSIRHVLRILKTIYSKSHFYYFHIDQVSREKNKLPDKLTFLYFFLPKKRKAFLKRELKKLKLKNVHVSDWSLATIWGGASLLQTHLRAMQELSDLKRNAQWDWQFVINLSESDFPIK